MKKLFAVLITVCFISFLLLGLTEFSAVGLRDTPANSGVVATRYIENSASETGAANMVTGMILDYRAFDTFIESSVIFSAVICVAMLLKKGGGSFEN